MFYEICFKKSQKIRDQVLKKVFGKLSFKIFAKKRIKIERKWEKRCTSQQNKALAVKLFVCNLGTYANIGTTLWFN